jgi:hypothetical protein
MNVGRDRCARPVVADRGAEDPRHDRRRGTIFTARDTALQDASSPFPGRQGGLVPHPARPASELITAPPPADFNSP